MKYEWLNNGEPLPAGHRKAGMVGIAFDFEDGRPEPQSVYAESKEKMLDKVAAMYGNTQVQNGRLYRETRELKPRSGPEAPTPPAGATPPAGGAPGKMTTGEVIQAVADLDDPAKAGKAIKRLLKDEGTDLDEQERKDRDDAELNRMRGVVRAFMDANEDYYPSPRNAKLLRDGAYVLADGAPVTLGHFQQSFDELVGMDALESKPTEEPPAATPPEEPVAPQPARPRATTGVRPSTLSAGGARTAAGGLKFTYSEVMDMAGTDEYLHRLKHETGFREEVEKVLAKGA
jgi:hypothetical protein